MYSTEKQVMDVSAQQTSDPPQQVQTQQPRSKVPGQAGFGARMLARHGWEKGEGLGARGEGIITPYNQILDYSNGSGKAGPMVGKVTGGKKRKLDTDNDGANDPNLPSRVVKIPGMLKGLDVPAEIDKGLAKELGDYFEREFGRLYRVNFWLERHGGNNEVFVEFTNQVSAMACVKNEGGLEFNDNLIVARFHNYDRFDGGDYE